MFKPAQPALGRWWGVGIAAAVVWHHAHRPGARDLCRHLRAVPRLFDRAPAAFVRPCCAHAINNTLSVLMVFLGWEVEGVALHLALARRKRRDSDRSPLLVDSQGARRTATGHAPCRVGRDSPRRFDFGSQRRRVAPCHACWSLSAGWLEYAPGPASANRSGPNRRTILPPARAGRVRGLFSTYLFFVRSCLFFGPFCVFRGQSRNSPRIHWAGRNPDPAKNCQTIPLWRACHAEKCNSWDGGRIRQRRPQNHGRHAADPSNNRTIVGRNPRKALPAPSNIRKIGSHRGRCCRAARDPLVFLHLPLNPPGTTS